jgi:hypothetical protein
MHLPTIKFRLSLPFQPQEEGLLSHVCIPTYKSISSYHLDPELLPGRLNMTVLEAGLDELVLLPIMTLQPCDEKLVSPLLPD